MIPDEQKPIEIDLGIAVPVEFIEEESKWQLNNQNLVKPRRKFAPYTKAERTKRRKEVYRLHFEYGMPAVQIAEHMKINRNTINDDIRLLYREIAKESPEYSDYFNKMERRLEQTRQRVLGYLNNAVTIEEKISIEHLATDIDFRLLGAATKIEHSGAAFTDKVVQTFNRFAEKKGLDFRAATLFEIQKVSEWSRRDLDNLYFEIGRKEKMYNELQRDKKKISDEI